jgi:GDP-4-dehydro-6-deoxy-D-mannose reductase
VRVLVTGSRGFVGKWLVDHLQGTGDTVHGMDAEIDVTDEVRVREAIAGWEPEALCHLAAQASVGTSWTADASTYRVNAGGTLNVLRAAMACPRPPRVLLISSSEVYGRVTPDELPLREDHPFAPVSPYAASKAAAEMIGLQFWLGSGLEVIRARPFNHTGPGQRTAFVVPALAKQVAEARRTGARALLTGNLDVRRDLTDVRDVVRSYRDLLVEGTPGEVYNVCRGSSVAIREVAERLLVLAGVNIAIEIDPARVRAVDIPELRGDPTRLEKATAWAPEIPLDVTLSDVLAEWAGSVG